MPGRREVLLGLMLSLGGPAVMAQAKARKAGVLLGTVAPGGPAAFYKPDELALISILADTIIPRTDTPGALDAKVPAYLDKMMATWASAGTKEAHRQALAGVRARLAVLGDSDVAALPPAPRLAAIAALDKEAYASARASSPLDRRGDPVPASPGDQYRAIKRMIGQVYYVSEPGATQELHYELIPGRWLADAPLAEIGRTWAE